MSIYTTLKKASTRPLPFEHYTAKDLWNDPHISEQMLQYHLSPDLDLASRNPEFIDRSVAWIAKRCGITPGKTVADFGCGPGLYAERFAKLGVQVVGIDFSESSIAYARSEAAEKDLPIDYRCLNYLDYDSNEKFDLITMIFCDFCVLSPVQRSRLLSIFHRCLKDDGLLVLDLFSQHGFEQQKECSVYERNQLNGFWAKEDYYCLQNTFKYEQEKLLLNKFTVITENDDVREVYNWLQSFTPETVRAEFARSGLEVVDCYGNVAGDDYSQNSGEIAVVVRKKR